jgi:hypothetical protein
MSKLKASWRVPPPKIRTNLTVVYLLVLFLLVSTFYALAGFDFSDEGLYLQAVAADDPTRVFQSPFGLPLRGLWILSGDNITTYRLISSIILFGVSYLLASRCVDFINTGMMSNDKALWKLVIATMGWASYQSLGLPTPSYNFLTYAGALLSAAGSIAMMNGKTKETKSLTAKLGLVYNPILVGLGFALAFFGKFSSGLLLWAGIILFLSIFGGLSLGKLTSAVVATSLSFFLWVLALSWPVNFSSLLGLISEGTETSILLDSTYDPVQVLVNYFLGALPVIAISLILVALVVVFGYWRGTTSDGASWIVVFSSATFLYFVLSIVSPSSRHQAISLALFSLMIFSLIKFPNLRKGGFQQSVPMLILSWGSLVSVSVGSNNGFSLVGVYAGFSLGLILFVLTISIPKGQIAPHLSLAVSTVLITLITLSSIYFPYRQPPLYLQTTPVKISSGVLYMDQERADQVSLLAQCLEREGLNDNLMLDYTVHFSPGLVFALGNPTPPNLLGSVWGFKGSEKIMERTVSELELGEDILVLFAKDSLSVQSGVAYRLLDLPPNTNVRAACSSKDFEIWSWSRGS